MQSPSSFIFIQGGDTMERKIQKHNKICTDIHNMYIKKNSDYGDSVGELYRRLGDISFLTRISDKYNRLMNLMTKENPEQHFESIEDTIQDMANYCIIWLMEMEVLQEDIEAAYIENNKIEEIVQPYEEEEEDEYVADNFRENIQDIAKRITNKLSNK